MKKLLLLIILFSFAVNTVHATVLNPKMGVQPPLGVFGSPISLSATTFVIDAAWNYGVAGSKAALYRLNTPLNQTNGTLDCYVYATAKTGSPTNQDMILYTGPTGTTDPQRPDPVAIATSTNLDLSATTLPAWVQFSFPSVTISTSTIFLIIENTTATPASNNVTYLLRPQNFLTPGRIVGYSTTDGLTSDPVLQSSSTEPPIVCKFNDGTLMGNPYVVTTNAPNNTNYRGMRFQYDTDVQVAGFLQPNINSSTLNYTFFVYQGSTLITKITPDKYQTNNTSAIYFNSPLTFTGGLPYDIVATSSANTTTGVHIGPGTSPPADVANATFSQMGFVTGVTPGSFTYTQGDFTGIIPLFNNIPAVVTPAIAGSAAIQINGRVIIQ